MSGQIRRRNRDKRKSFPKNAMAEDLAFLEETDDPRDRENAA
jgi:hypothetical protein